MTRRIEIYDTTLRDGTQGERINFSAEDKCQIARQLDALGVDFIEGGWPGSNPRDMDFFEKARALKLEHARITAFGATRRRDSSCATDKSIQALLRAETPVVTIFGKSWLLHVTDALRISPEENLEIIADSVRYLAERVPYVIYDAEHFFDGYRDDPEYALATLRAAAAGNPQRIVLCDTNGGSLPADVRDVTAKVMEEFGITIANNDQENIPAPASSFGLGIHCHNDG